MARRRSFPQWLLTSRVSRVVLSLCVGLVGIVPLMLLSENLDTDVGLSVRLGLMVSIGAWVFYSRAIADGLLALARARFSKTK